MISGWKAATPPFDGVTVFDASEAEAELHVLRQAAIGVIGVLQRSFPDPELFVLADWHEHDGFGSPARGTTWSEVLMHCETDRAFLYFKTGDAMVFRAVYPRTMQFYLRIYVDEDSTEEKGTGTLDVSLPRELASRASEALEAAGMLPGVANAKAFFDLRAS
ncbi:MAG: hypothetical protein ABIP42_17490 [Planctomycetota bacterium]